MSSWATYKRLLEYTYQYKTLMILGIFGFLIYAQTQWVWAELIKYIFEAIDVGDQSDKNMIAVAILLIFLVRGAGSFLGSYGVSYVARKVVHDLRTTLFSSVLGLTLGYHDQHAKGRLLSKITFDIEQVSGSASEALKIVLQEGLIVIGLLAYLFYSHWKLSLLFLLIFPLIGLVVRYASRRLHVVSGRIQDSMGDVAHVVSETLAAFKEVKLYGGEAYERARFEAASSNNLRQNMKLIVIQSINTPLVQFLVALAMSAMVWVALQPTIFGETTAADFMAYLTAAGLIVKPIRQLTQVNGIIQKGIAGARSVFVVMDEAAERDLGQRCLTDVKGHIVFKQVSLNYGGEPALTCIDLELPPGKMVALVGRSGSGKSTLANIIPRFYTPSEGEVTLDGVPINALLLANLRAQISMVSQDVALFNDTIAHNIAYGMLGKVDDAAIESAARAANALDFIHQLPRGMKTCIGEGGVQLSGGERQRIAIARALLKNAPILILDEATSALDNESERMIQRAIEQASKDRTTLIIAHRLSTVEAADLIVVLDDGCIVEQGTHDQLIMKNGAYARLQASLTKGI